MKFLYTFLFLFSINSILNAQIKDSSFLKKIDSTQLRFNSNNFQNLIGSLGPSVENIRKSNPVVIVNGFIISDSIKKQSILKSYAPFFKKSKFYSPKKGLKRFGILSEDGILFIELKNNIIIDCRNLEKVRSE